MVTFPGRPFKLTNFKKILTLINRQKISIVSILLYDSILDASQYAQQNLLNSSKTLKLFWTVKKKGQNSFFRKFRYFFGISMELSPNFTDYFAATDSNQYIYKKLNFYKKVILQWLIKVRT